MDSEPPTIWVVNDAGHDYSSALKLIPDAKISYLSQGNINPIFFDRMANQFAEGISKFVKREDYLLIAGTPPANAVVYYLWMLAFQEVRALLWDAKQSKYVVAHLTEGHARDLLQKHM